MSTHYSIHHSSLKDLKINSMALTGIAISLISLIAISIIGTLTIPCGIIFSETVLFRSMILLFITLVISILFLAGSLIKIHMKTKLTCHENSGSRT